MVSAVNTKMVLAAESHAPYRNGMSRLRELRERAKLTQGQLAARLGTQQPQVARWEKDEDDPKFRRIPLPYARKATKIFECMLWELRPDILSDKSIDLLLEGAPDALRQEVLRYAKYQLSQKS